MSAKICCLCKDSLALDLPNQISIFGRSFVDEESGESLCIDCIQELEDDLAGEDE